MVNLYPMSVRPVQGQSRKYWLGAGIALVTTGSASVILGLCLNPKEDWETRTVALAAGTTSIAAGVAALARAFFFKPHARIYACDIERADSRASADSLAAQPANSFRDDPDEDIYRERHMLIACPTKECLRLFNSDTDSSSTCYDEALCSPLWQANTPIAIAESPRMGVFANFIFNIPRCAISSPLKELMDPTSPLFQNTSLRLDHRGFYSAFSFLIRKYCPKMCCTLVIRKKYSSGESSFEGIENRLPVVALPFSEIPFDFAPIADEFFSEEYSHERSSLGELQNIERRFTNPPADLFFTVNRFSKNYYGQDSLEKEYTCTYPIAVPFDLSLCRSRFALASFVNFEEGEFSTYVHKARGWYKCSASGAEEAKVINPSMSFLLHYRIA